MAIRKVAMTFYFTVIMKSTCVIENHLLKRKKCYELIIKFKFKVLFRVQT